MPSHGVVRGIANLMDTWIDTSDQVLSIHFTVAKQIESHEACIVFVVGKCQPVIDIPLSVRIFVEIGQSFVRLYSVVGVVVGCNRWTADNGPVHPELQTAGCGI